jgi:ectoine hydroxylase-related dioxygenase (phytanoyl-CoA dioxygenase family)
MGSLKRRKGRQPLARQEVPEDSQIPSISSKIAIFGNSNLALVASFVMLILSIWVATVLNSKPSQGERFVPTPRTGRAAKIYEFDEIKGGLHLSASMLKEYQQDGVIAIRGLVGKELLDRLDVASQKQVQDYKLKRKRARGTQFFQVEVGIALSNKAFQDVALASNVPLIAATLLQLSDNSTMRMMRDIFLVKDNDQYICGWHTDDTGFWPATGAAPGVNAWIALDDMPSAGGGGFALAVGSHRASWRHEAHKVTGSTLTLPKQGFRDVADMFANRTGSGTCNIKTSAPHLHHRMEESMRVYDVKRGDVIFHDRWLFHRTVPFDRQVPRLVEDPLYRRYSVRYGPGSSIIPPGYGMELSVLWDERNSGKSADEVSNLDGPWYPRAWPSVIASEIEQIPSLIREKVPVAEASRKARQKEMKPYLAELRKKQEIG